MVVVHWIVWIACLHAHLVGVGSVTFDTTMTREDLTKGQSVATYSIDTMDSSGNWVAQKVPQSKHTVSHHVATPIPRYLWTNKSMLDTLLACSVSLHRCGARV